MFRYLILADGAAALNQQTMVALKNDKSNGWHVTDVVAVQVRKSASGAIEETDAPNGTPACKIILA